MFKLKYNIGNFSSVDLPVYSISNLFHKTFTIDLKKLNSYSFILKDPTTIYDLILFTSSNNEVSVSLELIDLENLKRGATVNITTNSQDSVEATILISGLRVGDQRSRNFGSFTVKFIDYTDYIDGYEYVDLGLPSGTLWAKCNVGAETETDYGMYFQWGDTQGYTSAQVGVETGKKGFAWADYKYGTYDSSDTTNYGMTKYNGTDGKTSLDLEDDAAHVNMGGEWTMPTDIQISELLDVHYVTKEMVSNYKNTGVSGYLFTSVANSNTLFVPFSGFARDGSVDHTGEVGYVWSSSLSSSVSHAFGLGVNGKSGATLDNYARSFGSSVRGVCTKQSTSGKTSQSGKSSKSGKEVKP